jgi:hypothetical protein
MTFWNWARCYAAVPFSKKWNDVTLYLQGIRRTLWNRAHCYSAVPFSRKLYEVTFYTRHTYVWSHFFHSTFCRKNTSWSLSFGPPFPTIVRRDFSTRNIYEFVESGALSFGCSLFPRNNTKWLLMHGICTTFGNRARCYSAVPFS